MEDRRREEWRRTVGDEGRKSVLLQLMNEGGVDTLTPKPVVEPGPGTNRITYVMTTLYEGSHPVKIENSHRLT